MNDYDVTVTSADGNSGDTLRVQAADTDAAGSAALELAHAEWSGHDYDLRVESVTLVPAEG